MRRPIKTWHNVLRMNRLGYTLWPVRIPDNSMRLSSLVGGLLVWRNQLAVPPGESKSRVNRQRYGDPDQDGAGFSPGAHPPCRFLIGVSQFRHRKERQKENNSNDLPRSFLFAQPFCWKNPTLGTGHQAQTRD